MGIFAEPSGAGFLMQMTSFPDFYVAGVSYRRSDASVRGNFSVNEERLAEFYQAAAAAGIKECVLLSTCNRTEIFGFSPDASVFPELLCRFSRGSLDEFNQSGYLKNGMEALRHVFHVAAGMDSQILGDYEIVGQLKRAVEAARQHGSIGLNLGRMVNEAVRATKKVRTHTEFSSGTVSVSFAAVQYLKEHLVHPEGKKIVLIGTGKIGTNTCKNLVDYFKGSDITLMNRTADKAESLAFRFGLSWAPMELLKEKISMADAILVATASEIPFIQPAHLRGSGPKLIIDFSIPCNVSPEAAAVPDITLVGVDELSRIKDNTLLKRFAEIPRVEDIISEHLEEFLDWHRHRSRVPFLQAVKSKLYTLHEGEQDDATHQRIQKLVNGVAVKMRTQNLPGCHYIEAINDFMSPSFSDS